MLVTTQWLSQDPHIVYQKYDDTYNFPIFRQALFEMRRYMMRTDEPIYVIIDYTTVTRVNPFSMLRGGVMIENTRPRNAVLGIAVAQPDSMIYHYTAFWLRMGRVIGSKAARDFQLTTTVAHAQQIIADYVAESDAAQSS